MIGGGPAPADSASALSTALAVYAKQRAGLDLSVDFGFAQRAPDFGFWIAAQGNPVAGQSGGGAIRWRGDGVRG